MSPPVVLQSNQALVRLRCLPTEQEAPALEVAEEHDLTVIGFARGRRFNVYAAPWGLGAEERLDPASDRDRPPALASGR